MLNYVSVPDDASPVEVLRAEALDGVLTRFLDQTRVRRSSSDVVSLVALFSGERLASVWGVGCALSGGGGVSSVEELRVSRRDMRPSLEYWSSVVGPGSGRGLVVCVVRVDRVSGAMVMELGYEESDRAAWDVDERGVQVVAEMIGGLSDGSIV